MAAEDSMSTDRPDWVNEKWQDMVGSQHEAISSDLDIILYSGGDFAPIPGESSPFVVESESGDWVEFVPALEDESAITLMAAANLIETSSNEDEAEEDIRELIKIRNIVDAQMVDAQYLAESVDAASASAETSAAADGAETTEIETSSSTNSNLRNEFGTTTSFSDGLQSDFGPSSSGSTSLFGGGDDFSSEATSFAADDAALADTSAASATPPSSSAPSALDFFDGFDPAMLDEIALFLEISSLTSLTVLSQDEAKRLVDLQIQGSAIEASFTVFDYELTEEDQIALDLEGDLFVMEELAWYFMDESSMDQFTNVINDFWDLVTYVSYGYDAMDPELFAMSEDGTVSYDMAARLGQSMEEFMGANTYLVDSLVEFSQAIADLGGTLMWDDQVVAEVLPTMDFSDGGGGDVNDREVDLVILENLIYELDELAWFSMDDIEYLAFADGTIGIWELAYYLYDEDTSYLGEQLYLDENDIVSIEMGPDMGMSFGEFFANNEELLEKFVEVVDKFEEIGGQNIYWDGVIVSELVSNADALIAEAIENSDGSENTYVPLTIDDLLDFGVDPWFDGLYLWESGQYDTDSDYYELDRALDYIQYLSEYVPEDERALNFQMVAQVRAIKLELETGFELGLTDYEGFYIAEDGTTVYDISQTLPGDFETIDDWIAYYPYLAEPLKFVAEFVAEAGYQITWGEFDVANLVIDEPYQPMDWAILPEAGSDEYNLIILTDAFYAFDDEAWIEMDDASYDVFAEATWGFWDMLDALEYSSSEVYAPLFIDDTGSISFDFGGELGIGFTDFFTDNDYLLDEFESLIDAFEVAGQNVYWDGELATDLLAAGDVLILGDGDEPPYAPPTLDDGDSVDLELIEDYVEPNANEVLDTTAAVLPEMDDEFQEQPIVLNTDLGEMTLDDSDPMPIATESDADPDSGDFSAPLPEVSAEEEAVLVVA